MIDFTGYDPIKWTLDFHQFLIKNYKLIYQELLDNDELSEFHNSDYELDDIILDEILKHVLKNNLNLRTLKNCSICLNAKNNILSEEYKNWTIKKKDFYFRKLVSGKKTNPEDLKMMHQKDWEFLYTYYNEGFPIKEHFKSVFFNEPNASKQLKRVNENICMLIRGIFNSREIAEVFKDRDPVYYNDIINSDVYVTDLIGK